MDLFERLGNLVSGKGFASNKERANSDAKRRREEEERKRRAAAAAKQKTQQRVQKTQQSQAEAEKRKTVASPLKFPGQPEQAVPIVGPNVPKLEAKPLVSAPAPVIDLPNLGKKLVNNSGIPDEELIAGYNSANTEKEFNESRKIFNDILNDPKHPDHEQVKRIAPKVSQNRLLNNAQRSVAEAMDYAGSIAHAPIDVAQGLAKAPVRIYNKLTGTKETKLSDGWAKVLGEDDKVIGDTKAYGQETAAGVGQIFGQDWSKSPDWVQETVGAGMTGLDLTPLAGVAIGTKVGIKQGVAQGAMRMTGSRAILAKQELEAAANAARAAEQAAANVPKTVPIAPGMESTNMAVGAQRQAEVAVLQARKVEEQAAIVAEQAAKDAQLAKAVASAQDMPTDPGDIPFIETPVPEVKPSKVKDAGFVQNKVVAAEERLNFLKREFATQAEIKQAEAELARAKNEVIEVTKAATPRAIATADNLVKGKPAADAPAPVVKDGVTTRKLTDEELANVNAAAEARRVATEKIPLTDAKTVATKTVDNSTPATNPEDGFANIFTTPDGRKVAMVHPASKKAPKTVKSVRVDEPAPPAPKVEAPKVTKTVAATPELTKAGKVRKAWVQAEVKRISEDKTLSAKQQVAAIKKLSKTVKSVEDARVAELPPVSKKRALAKPEAQQLAGRKARVEQRKQAKAAGVKIEKGKKEGGSFAEFSVNRTKLITGNSQLKNDFMSSVKNKEKVNFEDDYKAAHGRIAEKTDADVVAQGRDMMKKAAGDAETDGGLFRSLSYTDQQDVLALTDRYSYIVDTISSKKKPSKKDLRLLEDTKQAQVDLLELATESVGDTGRSLSLIGWLYKQLDPNIVSQRILKKMEAEGAPYTKKQAEQVTKLTKKLKDKYDAHDASVARIEQLKNKLGKEDPDMTPEQVRAELVEHLDTLKSKEDELRKAYNEINVLTKEHWVKNVEAGKVSESKTYGFTLNKYQKINMLSGAFGRIRDINTTGLTAGDVIVDETIAALMGKLGNALTGTNKFDSVVFAKGGATGRGFDEGTRKTIATYAGKEDTGMGLDALAGGNRKHASNSTETDRLILDPSEMGATKLPKKGWKRFPSKIANVVRGNVAAPSHIFGEIFRARALNRAGLNEAKRLGLKGEDAVLYARTMEMNPTQAVKDSAEYTAREISGLQANMSHKIDQWYRASLYKWATWDGNKNVAGWQATRAKKFVIGNTITVAKNMTIPFTSWPLGTGKNMVTRQSVLYNYGKTAENVFKAVARGDDKAANLALKHFSRGSYNLAKLATVFYALGPFLSDDDANGESFSPPYVKIPRGDGTYWSTDLSMLGPLSAPFIVAWSFQKAQEAAANGENPWTAYAANFASGTLNKVGLSSTLNGQSVPIIDIVTENVTNPYRDPSSKGGALDESLQKMLSDSLSQSIPIGSFQRDINSMLNTIPEWSVMPQTKVLKEDGSTDWLQTGIRQNLATIPVVNQKMEDNDEGKQADSPINRVMGVKQPTTATMQKEGERKVLNESIDPVLGNDKFRALLDEETAKTYDKASKKKLTTTEIESIRDGVIKGAAKTLEASDYDSYLAIKKLQADKVSASPTATDADKQKLSYEMTVAETLKANKVDYSLYKMYAKGSNADGSDDENGFNTGISESELKKLMDPESDYFNKDLANKLIDLDQKLADAGVSGNSLNANVPKYDIEKILKGKGKGSGYGSSGGGGGSGSDKIATDVGTFSLSALKTVSDQALKYRELKGYDSPIPNLAAQTAKTNLKKAISVQKGVKLS